MSLGSTKLRDATTAPRRVVQRGRAPKSRPSRRILAIVGLPILKLAYAYPARSAAVLIVGVLMGGIVGNAIMFQKGRHPAPLFGGGLRSAGPDSAQKSRDTTTGSVPLPLPRPPDPAPAPAPAPADPPPAAPDTAPGSADAPIRTNAAPTPLVPAKTAPLPAPSRHHDDGITALLRGNAPAAGLPAAAKAPDPEVMLAQQALARLGYDIKPDGRMGAATRRALDEFESKHHLEGMPSPLSPKLLHTLSAAARKTAD